LPANSFQRSSRAPPDSAIQTPCSANCLCLDRAHFQCFLRSANPPGVLLPLGVRAS
jgi:hypothetical protein